MIKWSFDHNFDHNGVKIMNVPTFILSLFGAFAWLPLIIKIFKPPKATVKLIGYDYITDSRYEHKSEVSTYII